MQMFVVGCSNSWTTRPTSCYLLDGHIMFDCGGGTSKNVISHFGVDKLDEVDYIFITHFHADHIFAVNEYLSQKIIFNYDSNNRLTVVGLKGLKECLECLFKFSTKKPIKLEDYINIIEIDDFSKSLQIGKYTIKPYLLNHGDYQNCGYSIKEGDYVLGYTGDTAYDDNLLRMVEDCNALICDVSGEENRSNHMGVEGYHQLVKDYPNKNFYAVHCNDFVYNNASNFKLNLLKDSTSYNFKNGELQKCEIKSNEK